MKKIVLLIFVLLSFLYANGEKSVNIMLGYDKPPFIFGKTTNKGIEADVVKEAFKLVGYKVNFSQGTRSQQEAALYGENEIDGVATLKLKEKKFFKSDIISTYQNVVITRKKDNIKINSIDDLAKIRFVSWKNSFNDLGEKYYKYFNPKNGKYKKSYNDNFSQEDDVQMFFSKKVDALVIDKTIFNWFKLHFNIDDKFTIHPIFDATTAYPIVLKDNKIRDIFNRGLRELKKSGRYDEIIKFYETQNVEKLIQFSNLLSDISSKYIFNHNIEKINMILKKFLFHPDILSICIKRVDENVNCTQIYREINPKLKNFQTITSEIYYTKDRDILHLGKLKLCYKNNYRLQNGILIPPLQVFSNLEQDDYNHIKKFYKKYSLDTKLKILLTKEEENYLKNHKTITVHNEKDWAPYNFNENGIPKGFSVDYIDLIAKKLGIDIKYIQGYSWKQYLEMLKENKIDVIANIVKNEKRAKYMVFTDNYMKSKKAIFSNIPNINSLTDLKGKTVAVIEGFYIEDYLHKNYPSIKVKSYKNSKETLYAVLNKKADALIENMAVMKILMQENGVNLPYMSIQDDKELITYIHIGVNKKNKILRDILQKAKNTITQKEYNQLVEKWFDIREIRNIVFTKKEKEYIKNKKTLKVCAYSEQYPFVIFDGDKTGGYSIEYLNLISQKTHLDFSIVKTKGPKEYFSKLENGFCDIASMILTKPNKFEYLVPTKPIATDIIVLVTNINEPYIENLNDIKDKKVAIQRGTKNLQRYVKSIYPNINLVEVDADVLHDVLDGKYYGYIGPSYQLTNKISKNYFNKLKIMSKIGDKQLNGSFGINVHEPILLDIINKSIDAIPTLKKQAIKNAWLSVKVEKRFDYTAFLQLFIVALIIISILSYSNIKQKKLHKDIKQLNDTLNDRVKEEVEKNKQQQLLVIQQNRHAQMGEMISMIAHQWRQPLNTIAMIIQGTVFKYRRGLLTDELINKLDENSKIQIKQMSNTIDDFRDFFKPEKSITKFNLSDSISIATKMLVPILEKQKIKLTLDVKDDVYIDGYPNELGQSLINILNNAKDALVENNSIDNRKLKIYLEIDSTNVTLHVEDNAGGIPSDIVDNIFTPYFSTKQDKNGTGLGLYMSKIIIEEHMKGRLSVENKNDGAVFSMSFKKQEML